MHQKFVRLVWILTLIHGVLLLFYALSFLIGIAGHPIGAENMSRESLLFACVLLSALPIFVLWIGQTHNLMELNEGYHKGSEIFISILILVYIVVMLKEIYFKQMLPAY